MRQVSGITSYDQLWSLDMSHIICWDLEDLFYAVVFSGSSDHLVNCWYLGTCRYLVSGVWYLVHVLCSRDQGKLRSLQAAPRKT